MDDSCILGGTYMMISGSTLGDAAPSGDAVTIGGESATVLSWNSSAIEVELPSLGPGTYPLVFNLVDGFADTR